MRFATIAVDGTEVAAAAAGGGWLPLPALDPGFSGNLLELIERSDDRDLLGRVSAAAAAAEAEPIREPAFGPLYRRPHKIWGIGLNYREHAADLSELAPSEPASFIKGDHTIIGPGEAIRLPAQSERVTAEAELGIVIGRTCWQVSEEDALSHVFGFCSILDQTAEDILARNPRFLTRSKNFPTFFSFGPELVTVDELLGSRDLGELSVATWRNGEEARANTIAHMTHGPRKLISFHSQMMPLLPGDVISTGTPGAAVIAPGDTVECRIDGMLPLVNPVEAEPRPGT